MHCRSLALVLLLSAGCVSSSDADPSFESIALEGVEVGETVDVGRSIDITLVGNELWDREVDLIVEATLDDRTIEAGRFQATFDDGVERQTAKTSWTVGGDFLRTAGRHEITLLAQFESAELRSFSFFVEVDPVIESVRFVSPANPPIRTGRDIAIEVRGTDVVGQAVAVDIRLGADRVVATLDATFVLENATEVAHATWTVDGDFLDEPQNTTILAIARFDAQSVESASRAFVIDPAIVEVTTNVAGALPGDNVDVRVRGRDVEGRPVAVTISRSTDGATPVIETMLELRFDETDRATTPYRIPGALAQRVARHEFTFTARYADVDLTSAPVIVDVTPDVRSISIDHVAPGGTRVPVGTSDHAYLDSFIADVDGVALVDQALVVEVRYGARVVQRVELTASANSFEITHVPDVADLTSERVQMTVAVLRDGRELGRSGSVTIARRGLRRCFWADGNGTEYMDRDTVDSRTPVRLVAHGWGLDMSSIEWQVWESDDTNDDHVFTFNSVADGDVSAYDWVTEFVDDGILNSEDEYYFKVQVGSATCESPILAVRE